MPLGPTIINDFDNELSVSNERQQSSIQKLVITAGRLSIEIVSRKACVFGKVLSGYLTTLGGKRPAVTKFG